jgi:hypothetical protein
MAYIGGQARRDAFSYKGGQAVNEAVARGRKAYPVADVLRSSGRALKDSSFEYFDSAVSLLMKTALTEAERGQPVLSQIALIAAGQMCGERDPLGGRGAPPWMDKDKYVTVLLVGDKIKERLDYDACGFTDYKPAAVYVADASHCTFKPDAYAELAGTLAHEYTHVAMIRMYQNASRPWTDDEEQVLLKRPPRYEPLTKAFNSIPFDSDRLRYVENNELRELALKDISQDWARYKSYALYAESVPYLVQAFFQAARLGEPGAVATVFGDDVVDAFTHLILPDINAAAQKVRAAGAVA